MVENVFNNYLCKIVQEGNSEEEEDREGQELQQQTKTRNKLTFTMSGGEEVNIPIKSKSFPLIMFADPVHLTGSGSDFYEM